MIKGECLQVMDSLIKEGIKVDMILCDPPYGTIQGGFKWDKFKGGSHKNMVDIQWDEVIDITQMFDKCSKIIKAKGRIILFSQEPYTHKLRGGKFKNIKFNYPMYWIKNRAGNNLACKKARSNVVEDINLFTHHTQSKVFKHIKPTYNLNGASSLTNALQYAKESKSYHPTQKPTDLLVDLIKNFSNEGETILDFTMGSGSTGVASVASGRKFIGIELDDKYFEIACRRVEEETKHLKK